MYEKNKILTTDRLPNKNRIIRALDFYKEAMREIVMGHLNEISGESLSIQERICVSLPEKMYAYDFRNLDSEDEIADSLEEKHFPYLIKHNWDECFQQRFGTDRTVLEIVKRLVKVRNYVSHPKKDPDDNATKGHLDRIADLLYRFHRLKEKRAVETIRNELLIKKEDDADLGTDSGSLKGKGGGEPAVYQSQDNNDLVAADGIRQLNAGTEEEDPQEADSMDDNEKPVLTVKPRMEGYEIGREWIGEPQGVVWIVEDKVWVSKVTATEIVADEMVGTRAELILTLENEIAAMQYAEEEYYNEYEGEEDHVDSDYEPSYVEYLAQQTDNLLNIRDKLIGELSSLPTIERKRRVTDSTNVLGFEESDEGESAMVLHPQVGAYKIGTDPVNGGEYFKVGDRIWHSTETKTRLRAVALEDETLRKARQVFADLISD